MSEKNPTTIYDRVSCSYDPYDHFIIDCIDLFIY